MLPRNGVAFPNHIRHGRTYLYFRGQPLYPFGYRLSYTRFAYSNFRTSAPTLSVSGSIDVSVDVKNTGARAGDELVQLYVSYPRSAIPTNPFNRPSHWSSSDLACIFLFMAMTCEHPQF